MLPFESTLADGWERHARQLLGLALHGPSPKPVVGLKREKARLASNRDKLLAVLKERRVITNVEAVDICGLGYSGRVCELRKAGHQIDVTKRQGGLWEIRLLS